MTEDTIQKGSTHTFIKGGLYLIIIYLILFSFSIDTYAANRYWVGSAGGDWDNDTNWATATGSCGTGGVSYPVSGDTAIFDGSCTNNITLDAAVTVDAITNTGGYTGTFNTANNSLTVNGNFQWDEGTFNAGSSIITVGGDWDSSSGTWNEDISTVVFTGAAATLTTFDSVGTVQFYNLTIGNGTDPAIITTASSFNYSMGGILTINNAGTLNIGTGYEIENRRMQSTSLVINSGGTLGGGGAFDEWRRPANPNPWTNDGTISVARYFVSVMGTDAGTSPGSAITGTTYEEDLIIRDGGWFYSNYSHITGTNLTVLGTLTIASNPTMQTVLDNTVENSNITAGNLVIGVSGGITEGGERWPGLFGQAESIYK